MTMKHLLDGLAQTLGTPNDNRLAQHLGLSNGVITRIRQGKATGMHLRFFDQMQRTSNVSADTLLAWYRLPTGAVLGRIGQPEIAIPTLAGPKP